MSAAPSPSIRDHEALADRHAALRWLGVALALVAALNLLFTLVLVVQGALPAGRILLAFVATALGLSSFGINNDTALHALQWLDQNAKVPARHAAEWAHERAVRAHRLPELHTSPRTSMVLPILALAATAVALARSWEAA